MKDLISNWCGGNGGHPGCWRCVIQKLRFRRLRRRPANLLQCNSCKKYRCRVSLVASTISRRFPKIICDDRSVF